jgi:hypothetical protein
MSFNLKESLKNNASLFYILENNSIRDDEVVYRTLKERLFSFPWNPFRKTKTVYQPKIFLLRGGKIVVSKRTKDILLDYVFNEETKQTR